MMRIPVALIADFAIAHEGDGKLYVTGGGIRLLRFAAFPATQPRLALALGIEVPEEDLGKPHKLTIEALGPGDPFVKQVTRTFLVARSPDGEGPGYLHVVSNFENALFPTPGDYAFSVSIDGKEVQRVDLQAKLSSDEIATVSEASALLGHGYAAFMDGRAEEAEAVFRDVAARYPSNAAAHNNLGFVLLSKGDAGGAIDAFFSSQELGYELSEVTYANIGAALYLTGEYSTALGLFTHCLKNEVFRGTATLFGINDGTLFPIELRSAADYAALMALNAAWCASRLGDVVETTRFRAEAESSEMAKSSEDARGASFRLSVSALAITSTK